MGQALLAAWCLTFGAASVAGAGGGALEVRFDATNGGVRAISVAGDEAAMNWAEGTGTWGTLLGHSVTFSTNAEDRVLRQPFFACTGVERTASGVVARYALDNLRAEVTRTLADGELTETYEIRNAGRTPHYFLRGHLGILTTFNDSYIKGAACQTTRCHAHVFTGGEVSWVHALKMGRFPTELLLTLEEGALDGYSVRRIRLMDSNDRGDIVLHPAPFSLRPGESKRLRWRVKAIPAGSFVPPVAFKYETVFPGENFEVTVEGRRLTFPAGKPGEPREFDFRLSDGRTCRARGYTAPPIEELAARRVRFIVRNQQCRDPLSPLDGAFLPYSNADRQPYYDSRFLDHNACRERLQIGLFLIGWLREHPDAEVAEAVDRFERFVLREIVNPETGATYNEIGRDERFLRLYNSPVYIAFFRALYDLRGERKYLDLVERLALRHYRNGGAKFYANFCHFASVAKLLEDDGRDVAELKGYVRRHVENILANGTDYPPHEVNFEQTIVAPAASLLIDWCRSFGDDARIRAGARLQLDELIRFDGDQPSYLQGGTAIRHWDGYWFGGEMLYGDVLHYLSSGSSLIYWEWYKLTGETAYRTRAERGFRNLLCLFHGDGTASACRFLPLSVTYLNPDGTQREPSRPGERFDSWSNDQDGCLSRLYECGLFK